MIQGTSIAKGLARLRRSVLAFVGSRKGGAMLIGGSLAMVSMAGAGGMMVNYGWHEAQKEEIDGALRAGVSASALLMRGKLTQVEEQIKERVADVMRGLLGNITISKDDIEIVHDSATNQTTIRIAGTAKFWFANLWGGGGIGATESLTGTSVTVAFDVSQYEFAIALNVSPSMNQVPFTWTETKLDAVQDAIRTVGQTVDTVSQTDPGTITLAIVPFSSVVNVADTSGTSRTDAKERYVRMLTGAEYSTQTSRDTEDHWVDTFHYYGTGADMGPLASRSLPDFLAAADWNLHKAGTENVSTQAPTVGTWSFEGKDFWNGCVMARWGAYWDVDARPAPWDAADTDNWPAKKSVDGWVPGSASIADVPLHLSDAPPDASDPSTRFTAFSWPDATINDSADSELHHVLRKTLDSSHVPRYFSRPDNFWHLRAQDLGGSLHCSWAAPIVPLTDDSTALKAVDHYDVRGSFGRRGWGQTFLHLGVVWGLRALSPLWRDVWDTKDASGDVLPRTPCRAGGPFQGCSQFVNKAILIISDGGNNFGTGAPRGRRVGTVDRTTAITSNFNLTQPQCRRWFRDVAAYKTAMSATDATTFAGNFDTDATGVFDSTGMDAVLDAFQAVHPTVSAKDPTVPADLLVINAHRTLWKSALDDMTPWQLFRGYDADSPTKTTDATDVLTNPANKFGLTGRPAQNGHFCRPTSPFSAYGRAEDLVRVGDGPPVSGVAPFSVPSWKVTSPANDLAKPNSERLDDWFLQACRFAGQRGVHIHAIFTGDQYFPGTAENKALLESCIDLGYGGNPQQNELLVAPTAQELKDAIIDVIDIRRRLRFVDS